MEGEALAVYGKVRYFGHQAQMQHPDFDRLSLNAPEAGFGESSDFDLYHTGKIIPLYPTNEAMKLAGLTSRQMRNLVVRAFEAIIPGTDENLSYSILSANSLMSLAEAYREIHFPSSHEALARARYRMKWTELFYAQLLFACRYYKIRQIKSAVSFTHSGAVTEKLYASLPYELTDAQKTAIREIYHDLKSGRPMNRLLQGMSAQAKPLLPCLPWLWQLIMVCNQLSWLLLRFLQFSTTLA